MFLIETSQYFALNNLKPQWQIFDEDLKPLLFGRCFSEAQNIGGGNGNLYNQFNVFCFMTTVAEETVSKR